MGFVLLFLHSFDPVNENILNLLEHTSKELNIKKVVLMHDYFEKPARIFTQSEKIILINASIQNRQICDFLVNGHSFEHSNKYFLYKILDLKKQYEEDVIFWLVTSKQYNYLKNNEDFKSLFSIINIAVYIFPEDRESMQDYEILNSKIIFIPTSEEIKDIDTGIHKIEKNDYCPIILQYINQSTECAIKRIKHMETPERFSHSLRVAGTIKKMCEFAKIEDSELLYKCYMSAIYHDICKNLSAKEQIDIYTKELNKTSYAGVKVLHGPVGAWYMRKYFLYSNEEILNAIEEHTIPSDNPTLLTKLLFLADKLELSKEPEFDSEEYANYWKLIAAKKIDEAFNLLRINLHKKKPII